MDAAIFEAIRFSPRERQSEPKSVSTPDATMPWFTPAAGAHSQLFGLVNKGLIQGQADWTQTAKYICSCNGGRFPDLG
jgi:hypothetical protein